MAPSAITPEVGHIPTSAPTIDFLPLPERTSPISGSEENIPVAVKNLFQSALIEKNKMKSGSRGMQVLVSVLFHSVVILAPILASLYFTDTINLKQFTATLLVAPPPPPPPPPAAAMVKVIPVRRVLMNQGKLVAPRYVPKQVAMIKEAPIEDDVAGAIGGVPGGVPGGQMGGVIGGVIGGVLGKSVVPVAPANVKKPMRVGGHIRAPKGIYQPAPMYPVIARQARISGVVVVDAILDEQGNVMEMKVISGPPLLYQAAMDALKQWKYEPTYLNDTPISVQMIVNVTFQLSASS